MRKNAIAIAVALLLFLPLFTLAQNTITGHIVNSKDGTPVSGATVLVKGKTSGVKTDANGNFTINASPGDVLTVSSVNFTPQNIKVRAGGSINVQLVQSDVTMGEVVVTAMDIKKNSRSLGYSVQTVKGSDIQNTQRENFVNSLQGRVAGLTVTPSSGAAGASTGIVLRGFNTLSGTNQPLFIIDGVIVDNQTMNSNSQGGSGIGLASDGNNRNNDNTNRIADLNPNDIESVTVLKGPEATALYGSQASSGAIVITTRKARNTNGKLQVSYDYMYRLQKIDRFADVNNDYSPGSSNIPAAPTATGTTAFTAFGPAWPNGTKLYDNIHNFFRVGSSQNHNLSLEYGSNNVGFRVTGQYFKNNGVVPNNSYQKYNLTISNNTRLNKFISFNPSISFIRADNYRPLKSSTSTLAAGGYMVELYEWPANLDVTNYQDLNGNKLFSYSQTNRNSDFDNPLWSAKNNKAYDQLNRVIATMGIDITPFSWLTLAGRFGYDNYRDDGYQFIHPESYILTSAQGGSLDNYYRRYYGYNHTISATAKKTMGDFSGSIMVGTMWQDLETKQYGIYGTGIVDSITKAGIWKGGHLITAQDFNLKDSSITAPNTRLRLQRASQGLPNLSVFRELAYFGEASLSYKNLAFLTYSHRFEEASPIPQAHRNYNYPGASASLIVSDLFPFLKRGNILSYAKLRAAMAVTARVNDPYSNQRVFVPNFSSTVLPATYTLSFTNTNVDLIPEKQKTFEVGTELRFLGNRISFEGSYYNTLNSDQIVQGFRASYATSGVLNTQNAATVRNEGVEGTLNIVAMNKKNFNWTISFNANHMWSEVLKLPDAIGPLNDFYQSDTYISNVRGGLVRGHQTGTLTGSTYQRNDAGQIIIDRTTGIPLINTGLNFLIGDRTPDFTLGTLNTLRYKNVSLSFLWDLKVGGDIYNGTDQLLTTLGKSQRTADRATPRIIAGVLNDGLQNTANPTPNTIALVPKYASSYYTTLPDEEFIQHDVNWLRLRDVTLNYTFNARAIQRWKALKGLGLFLTLNDFVLITNYYGADPAVNANNPGSVGVGGYGMDLGSAATPKSVSFGLKAKF